MANSCDQLTSFLVLASSRNFSSLNLPFPSLSRAFSQMPTCASNCSPRQDISEQYLAVSDKSGWRWFFPSVLLILKESYSFLSILDHLIQDRLTWWLKIVFLLITAIIPKSHCHWLGCQLWSQPIYHKRTIFRLTDLLLAKEFLYCHHICKECEIWR